MNRLHGMRYRTEKRQRPVAHTIDGDTRIIDETYTAHVPVPPRDWDHIVLNAVTAGAALLVTASVAWSTASIGDLLARAVVIVIAYVGATVFDLAWIMCMAVEWLARFDTKRARGPRRAGHVALAVAMVAVCVHGWLEDSLAVGIAGAAVSALAKGMWTVVLKHHSRPLDSRTQQWLVQRDSEIGAKLALAARQRHLDRIEQQHAMLLPAAPDSEPDTAARPDRARGTVRAAVRAAVSTMPEATAEEIADHLSGVGIDTDADTVQTVLDADTDTTDSRSRGVVRPIAPRGQTISDAVRTALAAGVRDRDSVFSYVRSVHGDAAKADSVERIRNRELRKQVG